MSSSREGGEAPIVSGGKRKKKRKKFVKGKLSLAREDDGNDGTDDGCYSSSAGPTRSNSEDIISVVRTDKRKKINPQLRLLAPEVLTRSPLLSEAQGWENLREFSGFAGED